MAEATINSKETHDMQQNINNKKRKFKIYMSENLNMYENPLVKKKT